MPPSLLITSNVYLPHALLISPNVLKIMDSFEDLMIATISLPGKNIFMLKLSTLCVIVRFVSGNRVALPTPFTGPLAIDP